MGTTITLREHAARMNSVLHLAALNVPSPPRFNLMAGGLAAWILAEIIGHWPVR